MRIKKLEVFAEVENHKFFLVFVQGKQVLAQPGATPNHLPEFYTAANRFKKYEVAHFRHINACIEHIYRHGNLWHFCFVLKLVEQVVAIFLLIIDYFQKRALIRRILFVKPFFNKHGMLMRTGKYNGFRQFVASFYLDAMFHQMANHFIHRIGIEEPLVQCGCIYFIGKFTGNRVGKLFFIGQFLFIAQFGIFDAPTLKFDEYRNSFGGYQKTVVYGLLQLVGKSGVVGFHAKQCIGVPVGFRFGGGG